MKTIKFSQDTKHRKQWFTGISFSHPAKMSLPLQLWLIDNFTKEGETILDPMAGSGTVMVACSTGRNVICVELESKFYEMMKGNWAKIQQRGCQLGYSMGTATILQGDARNLTGILVDKIITSPPYAEGVSAHKQMEEQVTKGYFKGIITKQKEPMKTYKNRALPQNPNNIANLPYGKIDKIITSPPFQEVEIKRSGQDKSRENYSYGSKLKMSSEHPDNITRLAETHYGEVDKIITSPPYAQQATGKEGGGRDWTKADPSGRIHNPEVEGRSLAKAYSDNADNLGNLPYGSIDAVISSPPYEEAMGKKHHSPRADKLAEEKVNPTTYTDKVDAVISSPPYEGSGVGKRKDTGNIVNLNQQVVSRNRPLNIATGQTAHQASYADQVESNIGNLKSDSYLSSMLQVYQQCYAVLKDGGLMVLVCKNFIRQKKIVRLDLDTIRLCEQAGFTFQDRWYRELASQSFWRTIYHQRYPLVPLIKYEDVLIFEKCEMGLGV